MGSRPEDILLRVADGRTRSTKSVRADIRTVRTARIALRPLPSLSRQQGV